MGVKISNLPAIVTPALTDVFPVVQAGVTFKETFTQLGSLFATLNDDVTFSSITFDPNTKGIAGTPTNDNAAASYVGELNSTIVLVGAPVSLTSTVTADVVTLVLQPGDYDVWGELWTLPNAATTTSAVVASLNTSSATTASVPSANTSTSSFKAALAAGVDLTLPIGACRISVATATTATVYLTANATFAVNTLAAYGKILARRRR